MAKLPKSLTRVTGFSKALALLLLLAFIAAAFYTGMLYQQKYAAVIATITPTPTPVAGQLSCTTDADCTLTTANVASSCCPNIKCLRYADDTVIAVNTTWLAQEKNTVCGVRKICPMIATMCTREITEENARYSAKCVQHICQKIKS